MRIEEILHLVEAVSNSALTEFKYEEGAVKLALKKTVSGQITVPGAVTSINTNLPALSVQENTAMQLGQQPMPVTDEVAEQKIATGNVVKSPLVGTFYAAPSEDAAPFVKVGDNVKEGQIIAIVEAMKLMNDIESDFAGTIVEVLVQNGEAVEYGQPLFVIA